MKIKILIAICFSILVYSCENSVDPPIESPVLYITLKVGDIHQYKSEDGSSYFQWEVIGTTKRADGLQVFELEEAVVLSNGIWKGQNYYYVDDAYFIITQLDTIDSLGIEEHNPFFEQRIAKIYPDEGDYFQSNVGVPETDKIFMSATFVDTMMTFVKTFEDVANYTALTPDTSQNYNYFYAQTIGHIATESQIQNETLRIYLTYCRSNEKEIGEYIPFETSNLSKLDKKGSVFSFLFKRQKY